NSSRAVSLRSASAESTWRWAATPTERWPSCRVRWPSTPGTSALPGGRARGWAGGWAALACCGPPRSAGSGARGGRGGRGWRAFGTRPRVSALAGPEVVFADGSRERADVLVFATGYRISFPFLDPELCHVRGWEFPLYRRTLSPHAPGLAFVGMLEPGPGLFEIVERQAQWL